MIKKIKSIFAKKAVIQEENQSAQKENKPDCDECGKSYHGYDSHVYHHHADCMCWTDCKICGVNILLHRTGYECDNEEIGSVICDRCKELEETLDYFANKYNIVPDLNDVKRFMK